MKELIKEGAMAPAFKAKDTSENDVSLSDYKGKWLVLYFYPRDNTPGCTIEANDFTKHIDNFVKLNASILGVSKDSCASHQKFTDKKKLKINLLSDPENEVQKAFGAWRIKKFMGREFMGTVRSTVLIDPNGKVNNAWDNVKARGHAEAVLEHLSKQ